MSKPIEDQTFLRLIGVGLDPDIEQPDLYYLLYEADKDTPVTDSGRILFFRDPTQSKIVADQFASHLSVDNFDIESPLVVCDIAETLYYLTHGGVDESDTVVNSVNLLLDLVDATGLELANWVRPVLVEVADYCTFHRDISGLPHEKYSIQDRVSAILLSVGAIVVRSRVL
jgi:hypothetical protein